MRKVLLSKKARSRRSGVGARTEVAWPASTGGGSQSRRARCWKESLSLCQETQNSDFCMKCPDLSMLATFLNISHSISHINLYVQPVMPRYDLCQKNLSLCMRGFAIWGPKLNRAEKLLNGWREEGRNGVKERSVLSAPAPGLPSDHNSQSWTVLCSNIKWASHCQLGTKETSRYCQEKRPLGSSKTLGRCKHLLLEPGQEERLSPEHLISSELH